MTTSQSPPCQTNKQTQNPNANTFGGPRERGYLSEITTRDYNFIAGTDHSGLHGIFMGTQIDWLTARLLCHLPTISLPHSLTPTHSLSYLSKHCNYFTFKLNFRCTTKLSLVLSNHKHHTDFMCRQRDVRVGGWLSTNSTVCPVAVAVAVVVDG